MAQWQEKNLKLLSANYYMQKCQLPNKFQIGRNKEMNKQKEKLHLIF